MSLEITVRLEWPYTSTALKLGSYCVYQAFRNYALIFYHYSILNFSLISLYYAQFYSFMLTILSLFPRHFCYIQNFSSLCNITISVLVTQITNFYYIQHSTIGGDEPIVLLFLPIFLSGNSFILAYYAQYFTRSFNIFLKVQLYSSTVYTYTSRIAITWTNHELVIQLYAVSKGQF